MSLHPIGDQAVMASCEDEKIALVLAERVRSCHPFWLMDVVQAYHQVAIYFDLGRADYDQIKAWIEQTRSDLSSIPRMPSGRTHRIPCCYEHGQDFERITQHTGLARDEVIHWHGTTVYTVFAIGFCPGFPYLGYLPAVLSTVPRLSSPRLQVEVGSVGLTGRQTGIYTEARPGGWNIVGKTPLQLVNLHDNYFPLQTGDCVAFERIDERQYQQLHGERLN